MKTDAESLTALNDVQLIEKFQQGNSKAFDVLMVRYTAPAMRCIGGKIQDTDQQKDVFQDTWLKIFTELKNNRYEENGQFENWLITIAHHHAIQFMRDEEHYIHGEDAKTDEPFSVQEEGLDDTDKKVLAIINGMKPTMKRVIILYALRQMKCKEIAEHLHIEINTVTKILSRAYIMIIKKAGLRHLKNNFRVSAVKQSPESFIGYRAVNNKNNSHKSNN